MRKLLAALALVVLALAAYLMLWPVPIQPAAWAAPKAPDPSGAYPETTAVTESGDRLYIQSLHAKTLGWMDKKQAGL